MLFTLLYSCALILLTEIGDKTMLTALCLSTRRAPVTVLIVTMTALMCSSLIGMLFGLALSTTLPIDFIRYISAIVFLAVGITNFKQAPNEQVINCDSRFSVTSMFLLVFLSELGDKSQLTILALAAYSAFPGMTIIGAMLGFFVVNAVGVFVGHKIGSRVISNSVRIATGVIFLIFGCLVLLGMI